jgi:hypothetical protein
MAQKKNNVITKVVEWTNKIQRQSDLIINHNSRLLLIRNLHNQVHSSLIDDDKMSSKLLFQSLVLSYIKDNYTDIYNQAILR